MRGFCQGRYAVHVCTEFAAAEPGVPIKGETLAKAQDIPLHFMENIPAANSAEQTSCGRCTGTVGG